MRVLQTETLNILERSRLPDASHEGVREISPRPTPQTDVETTSPRKQAWKMLHGLIMRRARRYFRLASPGASSSGEGFGAGGAGVQGGALEFDVARCFEMVPFNGAQVRVVLTDMRMCPGVCGRGHADAHRALGGCGDLDRFDGRVQYARTDFAFHRMMFGLPATWMVSCFVVGA